MSAVRAAGLLAARSLRQIPRVPADFVVALLVPLFFFVLMSLAYSAAAQIPDFPTGSYKEFIFAQILAITVFTSGNGAGYGLVLEVRNGYLDKLLATPVPRSSILMGRLLAVAGRAAAQAAIVLGAGYFAGIRLVTGVPGMLVLLALAATLAVAWAAVGSFIALTTRSAEATEGFVILFLPLVYVTTGGMPLAFLPEAFRPFVLANPVTYVIEGFRALHLHGWGAADVAGLGVPALALAFAAALGLAAVTVSAATWALRRMDA